MAITLEELKQQNRLKEEEEQAAQPVELEADELQAEQNTVDEVVSADNVEPTDENEAKEVPLWMVSEDQTSQDGDQVPVKTHVAMKHKLKARAKEAEGELDKLRHEIEQLKSGRGVPQVPPAQKAQPIKRPILRDFDYDDDKYNAALDNWMEAKLSAKLNSFREENQQSEQKSQHQKRMEDSVNDHYERAAKLVNDGFLTADEYHASDSIVRKRIDGISPGNGDALTDNILSVLGEGSEKVMVALSRNPTYMMELEKELNADRTGSKALVYLGSLKSQFNDVRRKATSTPRPAPVLNGNSSSPAAGEKGAKKAYLAAHKSGDRQKAFDIKRKAKADGIQVKEW